MGSEMCIRDRGWTTKQRREHGSQSKIQEGTEQRSHIVALGLWNGCNLWGRGAWACGLVRTPPSSPVSLTVWTRSGCPIAGKRSCAIASHASELTLDPRIHSTLRAIRALQAILHRDSGGRASARTPEHTWNRNSTHNQSHSAHGTSRLYWTLPATVRPAPNPSPKARRAREIATPGESFFRKAPTRVPAAAARVGFLLRVRPCPQCGERT